MQRVHQGCSSSRRLHDAIKPGHGQQRRVNRTRATVLVTADLFGSFRKSSNVVVPHKMLKSGALTREDCLDTPATVYTVRISTAYKRGSALTDYNAGVMLCLVGQNGQAVLKTISPLADREESAEQLAYICSVVDQSAGANCDLATAPNASWAKAPLKGTTERRFQEGRVDEFVFLGPELGPLAAIYVAPQGGSWALDEINVSSSRTAHQDRFVCHKRLGEKCADPAVCLTPVPAGAVVYGSGDAAVILTKEQAAVMQAVGSAEYGSLKDRLLLTTAAMGAGGSAVAAALAGPDVALPFAIGGAAGLLYQWLLQQGADSLGAEAQQQQPAYSGAMQMGSRQQMGGSLIGSSSTRLAVLAALAMAAVYAVQDPGALSESEVAAAAVLNEGPEAAALRQLLLGMAGFFTYKVALVAVYLTPQPAPLLRTRELNRNA